MANSSGSNLLNMPDSDPKMGVGKTRRMTNSGIMTIFNNDLSHCMLIDVLPGTKKHLQLQFATFCKNSSPFHRYLYLTNDPACSFTLIQEFPYPVAISPTVLASLTHVEGKDWLGHVTERARTLLRVGKCASLSRGDSIGVIHKYVEPPSFFDLP